ncbi:arylamine N-acetyltransferase [Aquicoccus sp. SCR17]|nr:arylamine N-acetyltransferase [Carideicomes alvinocaridis]
MFDLDAYLARLGLTGAVRATPTRERLDALVLAHLGAIPFENLDPLTGKVPEIAADAVAAKLVTARRGGYCYEQNHLLLAALHAMGFEAEPLVCRVWWQRPAGTPPGPWTHMALRVRLGGRALLVDVGFGGCVPTASLDMAADAPQATPHEPFRLRQGRDGPLLEVEIGGSWRPVYETRPEPAAFDELREANHRTATESRFTQELMLARTTPEARLALGGNRFTRRLAGGSVAERAHLDAEGLERVITDRFGLPVAPEWRPVLVRFADLTEA